MNIKYYYNSTNIINMRENEKIINKIRFFLIVKYIKYKLISPKQKFPHQFSKQQYRDDVRGVW